MERNIKISIKFHHYMEVVFPEDISNYYLKITTKFATKIQIVNVNTYILKLIPNNGCEQKLLKVRENNNM